MIEVFAAAEIALDLLRAAGLLGKKEQKLLAELIDKGPDGLEFIRSFKGASIDDMLAVLKEMPPAWKRKRTAATIPGDPDAEE